MAKAKDSSLYNSISSSDTSLGIIHFDNFSELDDSEFSLPKEILTEVQNAKRLFEQTSSLNPVQGAEILETNKTTKNDKDDLHNSSDIKEPTSAEWFDESLQELIYGTRNKEEEEGGLLDKSKLHTLFEADAKNVQKILMIPVSAKSDSEKVNQDELLLEVIQSEDLSKTSSRIMEETVTGSFRKPEVRLRKNATDHSSVKKPRPSKKTKHRNLVMESFRKKLSRTSLEKQIKFSGESTEGEENFLVYEQNLLETAGDSLINEADAAFKNLRISDQWTENTEEIRKLLKADENVFKRNISVDAENDCAWSFKMRQIDAGQLSSAMVDNVSSTGNMSIGEIFAARTENLGALSEEEGRQRPYFGMDISTPHHSIPDSPYSNEVSKASTSELENKPNARSHKVCDASSSALSLSTISEIVSDISLDEEPSKIISKFIPELTKEKIQCNTNSITFVQEKEESMMEKAESKEEKTNFHQFNTILMNIKHKKDIQTTDILNHDKLYDESQSDCDDVDGKKKIAAFDSLKKNFPCIVKYNSSLKDSNYPEIPTISLNCGTSVFMPYTTTFSENIHLHAQYAPYIVTLPGCCMSTYISSDPGIGVRAPHKIVCDLTYTGFISKTKIFLHNPMDATLYYHLNIVSAVFNGVSLPLSAEGTVAGISLSKLLCAHSCDTVEAEVVFKPKFKCRGELRTKIEVSPTLRSTVSCTNVITYGDPHLIEMVFPCKSPEFILSHEGKSELNFNTTVEGSIIIKNLTLTNKEKNIAFVKMHIIQHNEQEPKFSFHVVNQKVSDAGPLLFLHVLNAQCIECALTGQDANSSVPQVNIPIKLHAKRSINCHEELERITGTIYAVNLESGEVKSHSQSLSQCLLLSADIGNAELSIRDPYRGCVTIKAEKGTSAMEILPLINIGNVTVTSELIVQCENRALQILPSEVILPPYETVYITMVFDPMFSDSSNGVLTAVLPNRKKFDLVKAIGRLIHTGENSSNVLHKNAHINIQAAELYLPSVCGLESDKKILVFDAMKGNRRLVKSVTIRNPSSGHIQAHIYFKGRDNIFKVSVGDGNKFHSHQHVLFEAKAEKKIKVSCKPPSTLDTFEGLLVIKPEVKKKNKKDVVFSVPLVGYTGTSSIFIENSDIVVEYSSLVADNSLLDRDSIPKLQLYSNSNNENTATAGISVCNVGERTAFVKAIILNTNKVDDNGSMTCIMPSQFVLHVGNRKLLVLTVPFDEENINASQSERYLVAIYWGDEILRQEYKKMTCKQRIRCMKGKQRLMTVSLDSKFEGENDFLEDSDLFEGYRPLLDNLCYNRMKRIVLEPILPHPGAPKYAAGFTAMTLGTDSSMNESLLSDDECE